MLRRPSNTKWQRSYTIFQEPTRPREKKYYLDEDFFNHLAATERDLIRQQQRQEQEVGLIATKTKMLRTFCPPLVGKVSRALGVIDHDIAEYITTFSLDQAEAMGIPQRVAKLIMEPDPRTRQERACGEKDINDDYLSSESMESFAFKPYIDSGILEDLKEELGECEKNPLSPVQSDLSTGTQARPVSKHDSAQRVVHVRLKLHRKPREVSYIPKIKSTSSTPQEALHPAMFKAMDIHRYDILLPEQDPDQGRPYGIQLEDFRGLQILDYVKARQASLPEDFLDAVSKMNCQVRFKLPEKLNDLEGLGVIEYLLGYCEIQQELRILLANWFQSTKTWERLSPGKVVKRHARNLLFELISPDVMDEFVELINFPHNKMLVFEVYAAAMALCARLYGSAMMNLGRARLKYSIGTLEYLDFQNLPERLRDVHLDRGLFSLLLRLIELTTAIVPYKGTPTRVYRRSGSGPRKSFRRFSYNY